MSESPVLLLNQCRISRNFKLLVLLILAQLIFIYYYMQSYSTEHSNLFLKQHLRPAPETEEALNQKKWTHHLGCPQWIVISTRHTDPTEQIKYIHDSSFDWCVVVVAVDQSLQSWSYKRVHFLSVRNQTELASRFKVCL